MENITFEEARLREIERGLNQINSRLSTTVERMESELKDLKQISDSISTLYEDLDKLVQFK